MDRIKGRFAILDQMTDAVANGVVNEDLLLVAPELVSLFGVETILEEYDVE